MNEVESLILLRKHIKNYDSLPNNMKNWLNTVVNRVGRNEQDFKTYLAMSKSNKDMDYLDSLKLTEDMSYYVVSERQEFLEKFRIYLQVYVPKKYNDYISFSDKVFLNSYVKEVNDDKFNIDEMIVSHKRLQIYCHKNNHMTDKQTAWVQGNLVTSDLCDRLIRGSKILVLAEYEVNEIESILSSFKLRKINIGRTAMEFHGLYNCKENESSANTVKLNKLGEVDC